MTNTAIRKDQVLRNVVELYIQTGEPVGSKAVSALLQDRCSSATIRNDMSELISKGYLLQPHTSAGRVPSAGGYRYYIDRLMVPYQLSQQEKEQIKGSLPRFKGDPEQYMTEAGKTIAALTNRTSLITTPIDLQATLKKMELIQMGPASVLIAVLTSSGMLKSKVCQLDMPITHEELQQFTQILNERFANLNLNHINPAMAQTLAVSFGNQTLKFAPLLELVFDTVKDSVQCRLQLEGQANLLLYKEFSPGAVIELFSRRESLLTYLQNTAKTSVYLGEELDDTALYNAGLIVAEYSLNNALKGKIGILGPMKSDYKRLVPTIEYIAEIIQTNMNQYL